MVCEIDVERATMECNAGRLCQDGTWGGMLVLSNSPERGSHESDDPDKAGQGRRILFVSFGCCGSGRSNYQSAAKSVFMESSHPGQACCCSVLSWGWCVDSSRDVRIGWLVGGCLSALRTHSVDRAGL